ncbi:hypothetical protein [Chryseoglobus sp. 28M-23]|uniref:hypothetical protein n=1 Tax=Chryseoglobus sp. 28M-23 TaxID=2772253 RepID=UPI001746E3FA|nr:hypothetical protein [Chryseoglobus sp. 28M-23]QOD92973.1 hypothetical protein IE160_08425 [Chryseoglobus sp. 28M-23]
MTAGTRERFEQYLWTVRDRLARDDRILGLVGMGSTAERHRVDEWSDHDLALVVAKVHLGAGKARRGETLAASALLRGDAVTHLLTAVAALSHVDNRADYLDPRRRIELTRPDLATSLTDALRLDEVALARRLLDLVGSLAGDRPECPHAALAVLRARHGWG